MRVRTKPRHRTPPPIARGLRRALDACSVGHIADGAAYVGGDFLQAFDGSLQAFRLDIGQHHFHAGLCERPAERKPDTCGSAGHKGCLAGEFSHGGSSCGFELPYLHDALPAASEFPCPFPAPLSSTLTAPSSTPRPT